MRKRHRNRVASVMDAAKKSFDSFFPFFSFSDEVIDNLFSTIQDGVERERERQEVSSSNKKLYYSKENTI